MASELDVGSDASQSKQSNFTVLEVGDWQKQWESKDTPFHKDGVQDMLEKHYEKFINKQENINIFLPLCGKAVDIKWLADKGHTVVGVECVSIAIEEFFEEQKVEYSKEELKEIKGSLYKSKDGRIKLYCCDIFDFNKDIAGQFEAIWDRGALVAINRGDRKRYSILMQSLMKKGGCMMLETYDYDETKYPGPPHFVAEDQIVELYGDLCSMERVEYADFSTQIPQHWGLSSFYQRIHLITKN